MAILIIGPKGIAETEGWEIRWAKPIGATKILERQRCINEAVAKSNPHKSEQTHVKCAATKKSIVQNAVDVNGNDIIDISSIHMTALQNFIKEKFNATCCFYCLHSMDGTSFMCKVSRFHFSSA